MIEIKKIVVVGVILLFFGVAIAPSIHFTTVNASQNDNKEERITPKELLFQTILDVANNREIQKIVFDSELQSKGFSTPQVLTKKYLNSAYRIGLILTKILGVHRMHSLIQRYHIHNQEMQKEISEVIEGNRTLKMEMMQLSSVSCGCEDDLDVTVWHFPILCGLLFPIWFFAVLHHLPTWQEILTTFKNILNCNY